MKHKMQSCKTRRCYTVAHSSKSNSLGSLISLAFGVATNSSAELKGSNPMSMRPSLLCLTLASKWGLRNKFHYSYLHLDTYMESTGASISKFYYL